VGWLVRLAQATGPKSDHWPKIWPKIRSLAQGHWPKVTGPRYWPKVLAQGHWPRSLGQGHWAKVTGQGQSQRLFCRPFVRSAV